ncbi:HNH endonuclease (plasmid) [Halorientalis pallida]|uniref:HNH endonuclease n=1 Tax=Halorientalis pallida TaxID=2479928 RepID=UPI003C6EA73B
MEDSREYRVAIKESAIDENSPIKRLVENSDSDFADELTYQSQGQAQLATLRLSTLGEKALRLQSADHDKSRFNGYIVSTGQSAGGYGRTTRNASSGWEHKRKQTLERDDFECQECGALGGIEGDVELHVDHSTPQFAGGTDDLENLQTLCRECHMTAHGSHPETCRASVGQLAAKLSTFATDAYLPIFEGSELKNWLDETMDMRVRSGDVRDALTDLERYDRFVQTHIERVWENPFTEMRHRDEYTVYYVADSIDHPDRISYDDGIVYDGQQLYRGDLKATQGQQSALDNFR